MVDRKRRFKRRGAMAVFANVCCLHMERAFTCSARTIVAANAVSDDAGVVEDSREPGGNVVAVITLVVG